MITGLIYAGIGLGVLIVLALTIAPSMLSSMLSQEEERRFYENQKILNTTSGCVVDIKGKNNG